MKICSFAIATLTTLEETALLFFIFSKKNFETRVIATLKTFTSATSMVKATAPPSPSGMKTRSQTKGEKNATDAGNNVTVPVVNKGRVIVKRGKVTAAKKSNQGSIQVKQPALVKKVRSSLKGKPSAPAKDAKGRKKAAPAKDAKGRKKAAPANAKGRKKAAPANAKGRKKAAPAKDAKGKKKAAPAKDAKGGKKAAPAKEAKGKKAAPGKGVKAKLLMKGKKAAPAEGKKRAIDAEKVKKATKVGLSTARKSTGKPHGANMFILYFLDTLQNTGGNYYKVAKECGQRWNSEVSQEEKDRYRAIYLQQEKNSKVHGQKKSAKAKAPKIPNDFKKTEGGKEMQTHQDEKPKIVPQERETTEPKPKKGKKDDQPPSELKLNLPNPDLGVGTGDAHANEQID